MGCLPESGGCERQRTDPFVNHLNKLESRRFVHDMCLDQVFRNTPQPEALYLDSDSAQRLVIERKTLVWPPDYVIKHKNDHLVADLLIEGLRDVTSNAPYTIELNADLVGPRPDLVEFAKQILTTVRDRFSALESQGIIGETRPNRSWRIYRDDPLDRRENGEPETGLGIRWYPDDPLDLMIAEPPNELLSNISRLFASCVLKFQGYLDARRVLLIDQQGQLRYLGDIWWSHIFEALHPPFEVPEIWLAAYDWITEWKQDWIFEKLHPASDGDTFPPG